MKRKSVSSSLWKLCRTQILEIRLFAFQATLSFGNKNNGDYRFEKNLWNCSKTRKVLPRERKRHTARRVVSTCSVALSPRGGGKGVPHPVLPGRYPHPVLMWGDRVPTFSPDVRGVSHPVLTGGYPLGLDGGYPSEGTWNRALWYPPEWTWDQWVAVLWDGDGVFPCEQTDTCENSTLAIPLECER